MFIVFYSGSTYKIMVFQQVFRFSIAVFCRIFAGSFNDFRQKNTRVFVASKKAPSSVVLAEHRIWGIAWGSYWMGNGKGLMLEDVSISHTHRIHVCYIW